MANYLTQSILPGIAGVDLLHSIDTIDATRLSIMTNCIRTQEGEITGRPGLSNIFTAGTTVHSIGRLNDRIGNTFTYIVGADSDLYCGASGAISLIDSGYSGSPLILIPYHPPVSGDTWMVIADSLRNRKVRASDCLDVELGLRQAPSADGGFRIDEFRKTPHSTFTGEDRVRWTSVGFTITDTGPGSPGDLTSYATTQKTTIDTCDAAGWTNNVGTGGGAPANANDAVIKKEGTNSLKLTTNPAGAAYYQYFNKANAKNLAIVGALAADDADIIHLWLRTDRPDIISEIRLYFVVTSAFDTATLPGTSATLNTDAYLKAFRPSDFTSIIEATANAITGAGTANTNLATLQQLPGIDDDRPGNIAILFSEAERSRSQSFEFALGRGSWTEYGIIGLPLRRADFRRIGSDTTRDWSGVTGLVISLHVTTGTAVNVWFDDIYLTGGYGPDTSLPGMQPFDYRFIHTDPRTGAKSNPSPSQRIPFRLDALRQGIVITPEAYGDAAIRQFIFRRGGTLNDNWYPVGENGSDGGAFTDALTDLEVLGEAQTFGTLQLDNDQPVTTMDASGLQVLAQPLPAIWDTGQQILMGCGDPFRKGHVYWSKPEEIDHWPAQNNVEVCSPSEELIAGIAISGVQLAFSRERMFSGTVNLSNSGIVNFVPTACLHGLVARRGLCVTPKGVAFVSDDGIYLTGGGSEQNITDDLLRPLFHGETKNGYAPVDFTVPDQIRLVCHDNEVWFQYRDTGGTNRLAIFSLIFSFWRFYDFTPAAYEIYSELGSGVSSLLIGTATGHGDRHTGTSDEGSAISAHFRTGALNQQTPRIDKKYGDILFDARGTDLVRIVPYLNNEVSVLPQQTFTPTATTDRFYIDGPGDVYGRNISIDAQWSSLISPPVISLLGISYIPEPDTFTTRITDWDSQGGMNDKYVKGIILEFDTLGLDKQIRLQADGATATTITVNANGRQVRQYSFPQFQGRILRLNPADALEAKIYNFRWIFDDEPLSLTRFETQETNHSIRGDHTIVFANITLRSSAQVTLTITSYRQDGTSASNVYLLPSTGGVKQSLFVPMFANKGVLHKYIFTASSGFWLYREESTVLVQPWGGTEMLERHPFGNDDIAEPARSMRDSALTSQRSGGS